MSGWIKAAEGTNFMNLKQTVGDMELPKGAKMRIIMDTPGFDWIFDMAGAELAFTPFIPEGMELIDIYGEKGQGIVELEADPAWLGAVILGLPVWAWIVIAGVTLAVIISFIVVMIKLPPVAAIPAALTVGAAMGIVGLVALMAWQRKPT